MHCARLTKSAFQLWFAIFALKANTFNPLPFPSPIRTLYHKIALSLLIGGILIFYVWLVFAASRMTLPDQTHPILFYSNQTRHDVKLIFLPRITAAQANRFF